MSTPEELAQKIADKIEKDPAKWINDVTIEWIGAIAFISRLGLNKQFRKWMKTSGFDSKKLGKRMIEKQVNSDQECPNCRALALDTFREDKYGDEVDRCKSCGWEGIRLNKNTRGAI